MIFVSIVIRKHTVDFPEMHKDTYFSVGLPCAIMGLAYLEKGSTVMVPSLCFRANSTIMSSFKWIGISRFWLQTALSSFGVIFTLNSVYSSQYPFCVWQKCHDSQPRYLQLLASVFWLEVCQFSEIV